MISSGAASASLVLGVGANIHVGSVGRYLANEKDTTIGGGLSNSVIGGGVGGGHEIVTSDVPGNNLAYGMNTTMGSLEAA